MPTPGLADAATLFDPVGPTVIPHGADGAWNARFTDPGAVVVHEGVVYVFQNAFPDWPGPVGVGLWRSTDGGTTFTEVSPTPVFDGSDLPYAGVAALASSVLVLDDGTWVMYFSTWEAMTWPAAPSRIGRATAPSPEGPWTADVAPVLQPGDAGDWSSDAVRTPSVVVTDDGTYRMWFAGVGPTGSAIGHATSVDGVTWTADQSPVMEASPDGWDTGHLHQPRVVLTPDGYVMAYTAVSSVTSGAGITQAHGLAVSADGINWETSNGPVVDADEAGGRIIWFTALAWVNDRYLYFTEVGAGGMTDVHLAVHQGSVLEPG
ncbi:MAG TPA: hypothetical protein DCR14_02565 [Acidimicrobiaceae bacterium]|nr:hypothetical protein [Acidimicrobiaceae bacterium]